MVEAASADSTALLKPKVPPYGMAPSRIGVLGMLRVMSVCGVALSATSAWPISPHRLRRNGPPDPERVQRLGTRLDLLLHRVFKAEHAGCVSTVQCFRVGADPQRNLVVEERRREPADALDIELVALVAIPMFQPCASIIQSWVRRPTIALLA